MDDRAHLARTLRMMMAAIDKATKKSSPSTILGTGISMS